MKSTTILFLTTLMVFQYSCKEVNSSKETKTPAEEITKTITQDTKPNRIAKATSPITIDGKATESSWKQQPWQKLDQVWLGKPMSADDFQGRYKVTWDSKKFYVLAEIQDDNLVDTHPDGLDRYWDDDCLEIFIDENRSKGNHQYNHSAFAYHIALDGKVTDINTDSMPAYYNHVISQRVTKGNTTVWETAIDIYDDTFTDGKLSTPITLTQGKVMGFALAYCDNDASEERENFIGSVKVVGEDKNRGWIDAGIFEEITLQ